MIDNIFRFPSRIHWILIGVLTLTIFSSCKSTKITPDPIKKGILFLGHTYESPNRVDARLEQLDLATYEQIWLGGDICSETTKQLATVQYLDSLFDLGSTNTHWAVGNHDVRNGNLEWIQDATGRKLFYTQSSGGMTVIVLNTNLGDADCDELNAQFDMIQSVSDTISGSSHLILLMHHVVWGNVEPDMDVIKTANAGSSWKQFKCQGNSQFDRIIYPLLKDVQQKGIQVMVISGDGGQKSSKTFEYLTKDGIWFLISGINNANEKDPDKRAQLPPDRVLYLELDPSSRRLRWEFQDLDLLIEDQ